MKKLSTVFNTLFLTIILVSTGYGASWFDSGINKFLRVEQEVPVVPAPGAVAPKVAAKAIPKAILPVAKIKTPKVVAPKKPPVKPVLRKSPRGAGSNIPSVAPTSKAVKRPTPKKITPPVKAKLLGKAPAPAAAAVDANAIEQHRLLLQPNGWECGYYSIFHYLATKHNYDAANLDELYATFIDTITKDPDIAVLYDDEDYTNGTQLSNIIRNLGVNDDADLDEVLVVDEQEFYDIIPTTVNIVRKINVLRERGQTFWALVCTKRPAHWVCLMFPAEGGCFGIDSLRGARPSNSQQILVAVKNLCLGIVPLPDGDQYHTTYHNYRVIANQPASKVKDEIVAAIHDDALANGFTEETFASLARYLNVKVQHDHVPEAPGLGKKKKAETIVIDDDDDEKKSAKRRKGKKR